MWYSNTDSKIINKMERYYERAIKLENYCNAKGKKLTISYGSLNYLSNKIIFDRENEEILFYVETDENKSLFFAIDTDMIADNTLHFRCDRKYFDLELGFKVF